MSFAQHLEYSLGDALDARLPASFARAVELDEREEFPQEFLDLLRSLQARLGMAVILVTHDLGVIADLCSRVVVMYAGQVVEEASVEDLFARPQHSYTEGLLAAIPQVAEHDERLASIPGVVPDPHAMPTGCRFHPRCPYAIPECTSAPVELQPAGAQHLARCIRVDDLSLKGAR